MIKILFLSIILLFQAKAVFGQLHIYPKMGLNTSFSSFSDNDYVSRGLTNKPALFRSSGIGLSQNLSEKFSLQGEILLPPLGHKVMLVSNYMGNRKFEKRFIQKGFIKCQQLNLNLQLEGKPGCFGWIGFAKIGAGAFFKTKEAEYLTNSRFVSTDPVTGIQDSISFSIHEFSDPFFKPGVLLGLGIKKTIIKQNFVSFGLTYQQGFSTLTTTRITYQADGKTFTNHILNKGTALVLEASYAMALRKKRAEIPSDY